MRKYTSLFMPLLALIASPAWAHHDHTVHPDPSIWPAIITVAALIGGVVLVALTIKESGILK